MEERDSVATEGVDTKEEQGLPAVRPAEEEAGLAPVEETPESEPSEIDKLRAELEHVQDLLRRKHADFENYRKRIEREQKEFVTYAASELAREILPVVDNLGRALDSQSVESGSAGQIREGVLIIYRQFVDILKRAGLREVEALGADFDPHLHEAVARVETSDHREGEIVEVLQKGYFLKDRLLRPAMVKVGHNPSFDEPGDQSESSEGAQATDEYSNSDA